MIEILIITIASVLIAQLIDFIRHIFKSKQIDWSRLWQTGGFPSSHATGVSSIATGIYLIEGVSSAFVVAVALAVVVCRDALGVRNEVGKQAKALNKILKSKQYNELAGHTGIQVFGGIILGIVIPLLVL